MESMILGILYVLLSLLAFALSLRGILDNDNDLGRRDTIDFFMMGLASICLGAIWPLSIFGMVALIIGRHRKAAFVREQELTRELAKG